MSMDSAHIRSHRRMKSGGAPGPSRRADLRPGKAVFIEKQKLFLLQGRTTTYAFRIDKNGWLEHLYYGPSVDAEDDLTYLRYANVTLPFDPKPAVPPPSEVVQGLASQDDTVLRATWKQWSELNRSTVEAARIENASWRLLNMRASRRNLAELDGGSEEDGAGAAVAAAAAAVSRAAAEARLPGSGPAESDSAASSLIEATQAAAVTASTQGPARAASKVDGPRATSAGPPVAVPGRGGGTSAGPPVAARGDSADAAAETAAAAVAAPGAISSAAPATGAGGPDAGGASAAAVSTAMEAQQQLHELARHATTHVRTAGDILTVAQPHPAAVAAAQGTLHGVPAAHTHDPTAGTAAGSGAHAAAGSSGSADGSTSPRMVPAHGSMASHPSHPSFLPASAVHASMPGPHGQRSASPGHTGRRARGGSSASGHGDAPPASPHHSPRHSSAHSTVPVPPSFTVPPPAAPHGPAACEVPEGGSPSDVDLTACAPSAQATGLVDDSVATPSSSSPSGSPAAGTAAPDRSADFAAAAERGGLGLEAFVDEFVRPAQPAAQAAEDEAAEVHDDTAAGKNMKLLEWSDAGTGDYRPPSFSVEYPDGSTISPLVYKSHVIHAGKMLMMTPHLPHVREEEPGDADDCTTVAVTLEDTFTGLELELVYTVFRDYDAIARRTIVHNTTPDVIRTSRLMSLTMDMYAEDHHMVHLSGAWAGERHVVHRKLEQGVSHVESRRGTSSHQHNPFIAITQGPPSEDSGEVVGFALIYSSNFRCEVDVSEAMRARVNVGMHPQLFRWNLNPGESIESPEAIVAYSAAGLGRLSGELHRIVRERIIPQRWRDFVCPVLLNTWEACYFQVTHDSVMALARAAQSVGVQLLLLDDGWFKDRHDDTSSLGDWIPDPVKLPFGLKGLAREVNALGMAFGLWVEPEMVNVKSELYRNHPDWALQVKGRPRNEGRNQLVLDFANPEVVHYITETLCSLLGSAPIAAVKWDMNRHLSEVYSPALPARQQGEVAHRYMLGVYQVLATLNERFPDVLIETCSGGGGRFDMGMLFYSPQIWTSDNTDALARVKIQMGTALAYPASSMGAHISSVPNHQTLRYTSLKTRFLLALSGTFGLELDLRSMRPEELAEMRQLVVLRKQLAPITTSGAMHRIWSPFRTNRGAWMFVLTAEAKERILAERHTRRAMRERPSGDRRAAGAGAEERAREAGDAVCASVGSAAGTASGAGRSTAPGPSRAAAPPRPPVPHAVATSRRASEMETAGPAASASSAPRGGGGDDASSGTSAGRELSEAATSGAARAAAEGGPDEGAVAQSMAGFGDEALDVLRPGDEAIVVAVCISKDTGHTLPRIRLRGLRKDKRYVVEELVPGTLRRAVGTGQIVHDPAHPVFQFGDRRKLNLSGRALMAAGLPARFEFDGDSVCFHVYEAGAR